KSERAKVDDFYAARDNTMPSLPWPSIAPPFTAFNGLLKVYRGDTLAFIPTPLKTAFLPNPARQPKHLQRKPQC
ncbi:hypothetical protein ACSSVY_000908, partial [Roseovarius sp. MBR-51]